MPQEIYILPAFFFETTDFDPGPGTFNLTPDSSGTDVFILKLSSSGNFLWAKKLGSGNYEVPYSLVLDDLANVYTTGMFIGTGDFDPDETEKYMLTARRYGDVFISKLDSSGKFVWAQSIGGNGDDEGISMALDTIGNIYLTGYFEDTADFDPGSGTYNLSSAGYYDVFLLKALQTVFPLSLFSFSATLAVPRQVLLQWQTVQEQNTDKFIIERSKDQQNFYSAGEMPAAGNSTSEHSYTFTDMEPFSGTDFYRLKMINKYGSFIYSKVLSVDIKTDNNIHIYPNPVKDILQGIAFGENETAILQITDVSGRILKQQKLVLNGRTNISVNVHSLPAGKYNLVLFYRNKREISEFMKLP